MTSHKREAEFKRILTLPHLVLFGITFVTPTAPFPVFGIVSSVSHGHMALAYLIGMLAMVLTAMSYGRMAAAFPMAGSAYTYARRTLHPLIGFLTGWMMLLDYMLVPLMSVIYLALTVGHFFPRAPEGILLVLFAVAVTVMNLFGLKVTNRANAVMTAIMGGTVIWFVVAATSALQGGLGESVILSGKPFYNPAQFSLPLVMAGTSIAAFSYLGFDGISTLAEDARDPKRDIGRATVLVCVISGLIFMLQAYLGQLVWPNFSSYPRVETAFLDLSRLVGGAPFLSMVSFVLLVAGVASAVAGQASASRLLYGMGRDRLLPPKIFAYIHPKYSTPTYGILSMGAVTIIGGFLLSFRLAAEAINFGAFFGFMCVNLSVVSHYFRKGNRRGGSASVYHLILPVTGFLVCLYIFLNLSATAKLIGAAWSGAGLLYAARLTGGFRRRLDAILPEASSGQIEG